MNGVTKAPGSQPANQKQFVLINLLKAGSAQLIVLHHLAFYGPMSDHARTVMPALIDWLYDYARIAVQVFLVIGGFLAAKSLSSQRPAGVDHPLKTIWRRYIKLAPPFIVAMLLAVVASAVAAAWMTDDSISPPPTIGQLWAHIFLLHGVLGYESLSAGAWYVAIDFQLYALMTLLLWLPTRFANKQVQAWLAPALVAIGVSASLLYFNRDADWDVWAPYFFGSYGLGALAWWASDPKRKHGAVTLLLLMMVLPAVLALGVDFRSRIAAADYLRGRRAGFGKWLGENLFLGVSGALSGLPGGKCGVHALCFRAAANTGIGYAGCLGYEFVGGEGVFLLGGKAAWSGDGTIAAAGCCRAAGEEKCQGAGVGKIDNYLVMRAVMKKSQPQGLAFFN
jgi:surface polysaccharide O-acyltransferase-like enzyme